MMKEGVRYRFIGWITYDVFKTKVGAKPNKFVRLLYFLLFPFHKMYETQAQVHYDAAKYMYKIRGIEITASLFDVFNDYGRTGSMVYIFKDEKGFVNIKQVETIEDFIDVKKQVH